MSDFHTVTPFDNALYGVRAQGADNESPEEFKSYFGEQQFSKENLPAFCQNHTKPKLPAGDMLACIYAISMVKRQVASNPRRHDRGSPEALIHNFQPDLFC